MSHCGNCGHNCCCKCELENCHLCIKKPGQEYNRCSNIEYSKRFICLGCRIQWKAGQNIYATHDKTIDSKFSDSISLSSTSSSSSCSKKNAYKFLLDLREKKDLCHSRSRCRKCRQQGTECGWNLRAPKKDDLHAWKLLKKVLQESDDDLRALSPFTSFVQLFAQAKDLPYTSYKEKWLELKFKYDTSHLAERFSPARTSRLSFPYPKKQKDYEDFLKTLNRTCLLRESLATNGWAMLRAFIKIRSILNYWQSLITKKRKSFQLKKLLLLPPVKNVFEGGKTFQECRNEFNFLLASE